MSTRVTRSGCVLPTRVYRHALLDSTRWETFVPRAGDIVICAGVKSGTTWLQTIVASLLWPDGRMPAPINVLSPWYERPHTSANAILERQSHRRCMKTHLPADGLARYEDVRYVFVGRDGRDAFLSLVHHWAALRPATLEFINEMARADGLAPLPPYHGDVHQAFDTWIGTGSFAWEHDGAPWWSHLSIATSWWALRGESNVLLLHYDDLLFDLDGEMRRVASFIGADVAESAWPAVVERCRFARMRARSADIVPERFAFEENGRLFFRSGTSGQWRDVLRDYEIARYERRVLEVLGPDASAWLARGRLAPVPASISI
jgi:aryl sulfotransferase